MDISRLFDGLVLLAVIMLALHLLGQIDSWRSAVYALHLRWERERRQAGASGVILTQRQAVQTDFEQLVSNRPIRLWWVHVVITLAAIALVLSLAWNFDDLRWVGIWLASPMGVTLVAILGYGWVLVNQANAKLTAISTTLYGPAPPRVKVKSIQIADVKDAIE